MGSRKQCLLDLEAEEKYIQDRLMETYVSFCLSNTNHHLNTWKSRRPWESSIPGKAVQMWNVTSCWRVQYWLSCSQLVGLWSFLTNHLRHDREGPTQPPKWDRCLYRLYIWPFSSVQFSRSVVSDSATPSIAAHQASLSITNSWSSLKLTSIESVMPSSHLYDHIWP